MDYSAPAFAILIFVIVYLCFLKLRPGLARLWLAGGGAMLGTIGFFLIAFVLLRVAFPSAGFGGVGLLFWTMPFSFIFGGAAGAWLVWRLTRPPQK